MDPEKFNGKYRIPTNRLRGYDYGQNGLYFVTICTQNREHYFGEIALEHKNKSQGKPASLQPTIMGTLADEYWQSIPQHYPFVVLDEYIIMPDHLHGIICIAKENNTDWNPNKFGVQSQNLAAIIRGFKSSVKRYANENNITFHWQGRFHDHIIRNEQSLTAIRNYIVRNPANWHKDKNNLPGLNR